MKTTISCLCIVIIVILMTFSFSACSKKTVELTKENYNDYISLNVTYSDFESSTTRNDDYQLELSCSMTITTYARKANITFDNVSIQYSRDVMYGGWRTYGEIWYDLTTDLSYEGYSQTTISLKAGNYTSYFPNTDKSSISLKNISGSVIVGK